MIGILPGLAGRIGLLLGLPFALIFDPLGALVFLFSLHSVIHTSASIPAILFALPSSAGDAATIIDGHKMAKEGRAGRALGASLTSSAVGGVLGAICFLLLIPIALPLLKYFGPPETLLLSIIGVIMIGVVSGRLLFVAISTACFGAVLSMIGFDMSTAEPRLIFGIPELTDGISLAAIIGGLFVVPEMLEDDPYDAKSLSRALRTKLSDVFAGMAEATRHKILILRSSAIGIGIGALPGLGSSVAAWLAYADAARLKFIDPKVGQGAIVGVIAPEAANNSKEGGAMVPTLFFGIPGSGSMAIMMSAFVIVGIPFGPALLGSNIDIPLVLAATVGLSNLIAVPMFLVAVPALVRLAALRKNHFVPIAMTFALFAACYQSLSYFTLLQFAAGAGIGLALKRLDWSRVPFLLGFVLGPIFETSLLQTSQIWGWSGLFRPGAIALMLVAILLLYQVRKLQIRDAEQIGRSTDIPAAGLLAGLFLALLIWVNFFEDTSIVLPLILGIGLLSILFEIGRIQTNRETRLHIDLRFNLLPQSLFWLIGIWGFGLLAGNFLFVLYCLRRFRSRWDIAFLVSSAGAIIQYYMLAIVIDPQSDPFVVGAIAWRILSP